MRIGYATSTVLIPLQRGPISRPRTSTSGGRPTNSTRSSAIVGSKRWTRIAYVGSGSSRAGSAITSHDQHRVSVAVKAIALGNRRLIRSLQQLGAGESRHQQQQRRAWQVKVSDERIDDLEIIRRVDEK